MGYCRAHCDLDMCAHSAAWRAGAPWVAEFSPHTLQFVYQAHKAWITIHNTVFNDLHLQPSSWPTPVGLMDDDVVPAVLPPKLPKAQCKKRPASNQRAQEERPQKARGSKKVVNPMGYQVEQFPEDCPIGRAFAWPVEFLKHVGLPDNRALAKQLSSFSVRLRTEFSGSGAWGA